MIQFDYLTYMEQIAIKLKDIGHTADNKKFHRISGIAAIEELITTLPDNQFPALMVVENPEGHISNNGGGNFIDTPTFEFYIVKNYNFGDHTQRALAKKKCKTIGQKIFSKMLHDKFHRINGLDLLQLSNIPYYTIGPFGDQYIAVYFSFDVNQYSGLIYNPNDWEQ